MRSWIAPSYMAGQKPGRPRPPPRPPIPALSGPIFSSVICPGRLGRVVDGREHQVLERLDVVRVDRLRVDLHRAELARRGHRDRDQAAAGGAGDLGLGQLGLGGGELLLHLLSLLHELLQVGLSPWPHGALLRSAQRRSVRA